jgi:hypothetical protein
VTVPAQRLTASDLYRSIDLVEETFRAGDDEVEVVRNGRLRLVSTVDFRIKQLVAVVVHMREPHHAEAMELIGELRRARISRSVDLPGVFADLRSVISAWDAARQDRRRAACPPLARGTSPLGAEPFRAGLVLEVGKPRMSAHSIRPSYEKGAEPRS